MANTNAPNGFVEWTGSYGGSAPNFGLIVREIAYGDTTKIYRGDPVKMLNTGYVAQWTNGTAVSQLAGIFFGCKYKSTSFGWTRWSNYWPGADVASTDKVYAFLIPCVFSGVAPTFVVQSDGTALGFADIGQCADVTVGTGSTATGQSGASLAQGGIGTTATLPFRIVGLLSDYAPPGTNGTDNSSSYNRVIVAANVSGTTGI